MKYEFLHLYPVYLAYTNSIKELKSEYTEKGLPEEVIQTNCHAQMISYQEDGFLKLIVFMDENEAKELDLDIMELIGMLTHECSHAADEVFDFIGEKVIGGEIRAYLIQSIMQIILKQSNLLSKGNEHNEKNTI